MIDVQQEGGFKHHLNWLGTTREYNFKFSLLFVIGDIEGNNHLCSKIKSPGTSDGRIDRGCSCRVENADNPDYICRPTTVKEIENALKTGDPNVYHHRYSIYLVKNAFRNVCFGGDKYGIYGNTPGETLHMWNQGLFAYAEEHLFAYLPDRQQEELDEIIAIISTECNHQSERSMPRTHFKYGISSMTKVRGQEKSGVLFLLVLSFHCAIGKAFWLRTYHSRNDLTNFRKLFEQILCYEEWLKQDEFSKASLVEYDKAIRTLMELYKATIRRSTGNGLKIPKFHAVLHTIRDMKRFGAPSNFSGAPCESNMKAHVKQPSDTTQLRPSVFVYQVGSRVADSLVLQKAQSALMKDSDSNEPVNPRQINHHGKSFLLRQWVEGTDEHRLDDFNKPLTCTFLLPYVKNQLESLFTSVLPDGTECFNGIPCFTEINRKGTIFRGSFTYRSLDPWHDWVYISYKCGPLNNLQDQHILGQIMFFVDMSGIPTENPSPFQPGIYAIIRSLKEEEKDVPNSTLLSYGTKDCIANTDDPRYEIIDVERFVGPAFVIPDIGNVQSPNKVFVVPSRKKWHNYFNV